MVEIRLGYWVAMYASICVEFKDLFIYILFLFFLNYLMFVLCKRDIDQPNLDPLLIFRTNLGPNLYNVVEFTKWSKLGWVTVYRIMLLRKKMSGLE